MDVACESFVPLPGSLDATELSKRNESGHKETKRTKSPFSPNRVSIHPSPSPNGASSIETSEGVLRRWGGVGEQSIETSEGVLGRVTEYARV